MSKCGVFSGLYFPVFVPEKTLHLNTFHTEYIDYMTKTLVLNGIKCRVTSFHLKTTAVLEVIIQQKFISVKTYICVSADFRILKFGRFEDFFPLLNAA